MLIILGAGVVVYLECTKILLVDNILEPVSENW